MMSPKNPTLAEKASLLSGQDFWSTEETETVPSIVMVDGPHGVRRQVGTADHLGLNQSLPATCFPPGVALGSSFDTELIKEVGRALGREARSMNVNVLLGPAINIKRSPLCGRNFEYLSEDPLVAGELGAAYVQGLQSEGVGASVKHFAANNQESDRMRVSADVDARTLREIYFPAFERVVKDSDPATVMCSYNKINGTYASENRWLLTDVLRGEWGFQGVVVSDWGAVSDRVAALEAGLDLEMPGTDGTTDQEIVQAVESGRLDEGVVDESVQRMAALQARTALPEEDFHVDAETHHELARRVAAGSIVLLRNEGLLPLRPGARVAVIGEFAAEPRYQGGGSSHVNPTRVDIPLEQLRAQLGAEALTYAAGYSAAVRNDPHELRQEAVTVAEAAEVAIVFAGLEENEESEGFDRTHLDLPLAHTELIRAVAATGTPTVVVLSNGGVVTLEGWHDEVGAIVEGWALGQGGGKAIADVLTGTVNPSGRLSETIPVRLNDTPSFINFPGEAGHVRYGEGVLVGYRYYETVDVPVRYPFGHGLSYTTFDCAGLTAAATGEDSATATVIVTNTGDRAGAEVVQLYVAAPSRTVQTPARELRAFRKVFLEPGESRELTFDLDRRAFAHWDIREDRWALPHGDYVIQVGRSAHDIVAEALVTLDGDVNRPQPLSLTSTVGEWFTHPTVGPMLMDGLTASMTDEQREAAAAQQDGLKMVYSMPMDQFAKFPGVGFPTEVLEQLITASSGTES